MDLTRITFDEFPEEDKKEIYEFLDDLRESGITNMFGASKYIVEVFNISKMQAQSALANWMNTFNQRHPNK